MRGLSARRHLVCIHKTYPIRTTGPFFVFNTTQRMSEKATNGSVIDFGLISFDSRRCGCSFIGRRMHVWLSCARALSAIVSRINPIWPMPIALFFPLLVTPMYICPGIRAQVSGLSFKEAVWSDLAGVKKNDDDRQLVYRPRNTP